MSPESDALVRSLDWGAITTFVGVCILAYQIYLQRREFKRDAITRLFDELNTPKFRKVLRFIYSHDPADLTLENLPEKGRDDVEMVTAQLDGVGFRLEEHLVPDDETYELFWGVVLQNSPTTLATHRRSTRKT